jgi:RNA polymerase sigma-70 factor (ECF subfamily)
MALRAAVSELPPRQREIVTMRFELDLDVEEIAVLLDIKESTVRSALSRAIRRLKDTLAGEEGER